VRSDNAAATETSPGGDRPPLVPRESSMPVKPVDPGLSLTGAC